MARAFAPGATTCPSAPAGGRGPDRVRASQHGRRAGRSGLVAVPLRSIEPGGVIVLDY